MCLGVSLYIGADVLDVPHGADPEENALLETEITRDEHEDAALDAEDGGEDDGVEDQLDPSDDEPDDTAMVEDTIGAAPTEPPLGFKYVAAPPSLNTEDELKALVGQYVLHAWDTQRFAGWFVGRISAYGCSARDLRATPSANFVVTYDKKQTKQKELHGRVASTLTTDKYGSMEWWVLLEPE